MTLRPDCISISKKVYVLMCLSQLRASARGAVRTCRPPLKSLQHVCLGEGTKALILMASLSCSSPGAFLLLRLGIKAQDSQSHPPVPPNMHKPPLFSFSSSLLHLHRPGRIHGLCLVMFRDWSFKILP